MLPMRDDKKTVKIELLSQWMIEAEFRNINLSLQSQTKAQWMLSKQASLAPADWATWLFVNRQLLEKKWTNSDRMIHLYSIVPFKHILPWWEIWVRQFWEIWNLKCECKSLQVRLGNHIAPPSFNGGALWDLWLALSVNRNIQFLSENMFYLHI